MNDKKHWLSMVNCFKELRIKQTFFLSHYTADFTIFIEGPSYISKIIIKQYCLFEILKIVGVGLINWKSTQSKRKLLGIIYY